MPEGGGELLLDFIFYQLTSKKIQSSWSGICPQICHPTFSAEISHVSKQKSALPRLSCFLGSEMAISSLARSKSMNNRAHYVPESWIGLYSLLQCLQT